MTNCHVILITGNFVILHFNYLHNYYIQIVKDRKFLYKLSCDVNKTTVKLHCKKFII